MTSPGRPAFSVIVPVYNGSRYLAGALATVQAQSLPDWEIIVVDDGSTDDLRAALETAASVEHLRVFSQPNAGLAAARNRGLAAAEGDYVAFLDVDDEWDPTYLARMKAALDGAPQAVAAFAGWQYIDEAGGRLPQTILLSSDRLARLAEELPWRNAMLPSALTARRTAVMEAGGFDEQLRACEDWDLWLRLKDLGQFVAVPHVLMGYRVHAASMTENVANIERERLKVNAKHLGPIDQPASAWPAARRRAVGYTYFNAALGYLRQGEAARGREKIQQAVACWPGLLAEDEFYYELGCAFQPRGLRGSAAQLDLAAGESLIRFALARSPAPTPEVQRAGSAWGQANVNLSRLALASGQPAAARRYAWNAMRHGRAEQRWRGLRTWLHSFLRSTP